MAEKTALELARQAESVLEGNATDPVKNGKELAGVYIQKAQARALVSIALSLADIAETNREMLT